MLAILNYLRLDDDPPGIPTAAQFCLTVYTVGIGRLRTMLVKAIDEHDVAAYIAIL